MVGMTLVYLGWQLLSLCVCVEVGRAMVGMHAAVGTAAGGLTGGMVSPEVLM